MAEHYLQRHFTPAVLAEQKRAYGRAQPVPAAAGPDPLGPQEAAFIAARDSFYIASLTEDGAPYIQHRGGPVGFLRLLDAHTLAFADFGGNRQLLTVGHLSKDPRVALFLMDYPARRRLKIDGDAISLPAGESESDQVERVIRIRVSGYDWNCPQHITPRYSEAEWRARRLS
ncbi:MULTISPECIES: pyridoxamine 5'-phosphate oxidase family protein [unclassified Synechococcus]|uniref:pyridoxamine 5'-phosphate oxidase family protein n=1 Tax=unclassified Synechococcus TaxID=2626047 RepID=UPI0000698477|nr:MULTISPECIES: pyridoxamine 5'-phosphate oxidase family protein [unclassified Synechococcus]EAQ75656.1 pyridoxamine 5'-phosphate oxidase / oxidoreductase, NAD-dependent [Synechococcus sp. WH 5701]WFN59666.1 pyridoxamine 5'-phosphate oxidase family protein [Synechococcus sp. CCFWC 502]